MKRGFKFKFKREIKENQVMNLELLDILNYMSSIATANISRDELFKRASQQAGIIPQYLKKVYILAKNYGYDYSEACKMVAESTSNPHLKEFLIRFSNALATGEEEEKYLRGEVERMIEVYTNKYTSDVEELKKWTDGYTALLVSVIMIAAIFLISTMVFKIVDVYTASLLSGLLVCASAIIAVYIIYRVAPYDKITHSLGIKSKEQRMAEKMSLFILPALAISSFILLMTGVGVEKPWVFFLTVSAFLAPIGIIGVIDGKKIEKKDRDLSPFLKSLGSTAGDIGITLTFALDRLDKKSIGSLEEHVDKLYKRLVSGIKPKISWYNFVGETGSELINKSTRVFIDATDLGGDPTKIGEIVSMSTLRTSLLRLKRKLVSSGFCNLIIPLHVSMTGLLIFIYKIMATFNNAMIETFKVNPIVTAGGMENIPAGFGIFNALSPINISFIAKYVTILILVLTLSSAFSSNFADGGSNYKLCFYASILFALSAIVLFAVPILADKIFMLQLQPII
jgi:flagellar protein FlaJ